MAEVRVAGFAVATFVTSVTPHIFHNRISGVLLCGHVEFMFSPLLPVPFAQHGLSRLREVHHCYLFNSIIFYQIKEWITKDKEKTIDYESTRINLSGIN